MVLHTEEQEEKIAVIWIALALFLIGFGLSWFFVTRNFIFNILIGLLLLGIYYGVVTVQFDYKKLIPFNITESWLK